MSNNPSLPSVIVNGFGTKSASGNVKLAGRGKVRRTFVPAMNTWVPVPEPSRPVFAIYRAVGATCPKDCALLDNGCYAQHANVNIHQRRAADRTFDIVGYIVRLPLDALLRGAVSGDALGEDGPEYRRGLALGLQLRPDVSCWTYTHAWRRPEIIEWMRSAPANLTIVASVDDPKDIAEAEALGWSTVATVVPTEDGKGFSDAEARQARKEHGALPCPAQRMDMGCADCTACARPGRILFAVHGPARKRARTALAERRLQVLQ